MTKLKLTLLSLVLFGALFIIAGCGGDSDSSSQESSAAAAVTKPLTKAAFIKRGDEICAKADEDVYNRASAYRETHEKQLGKLSPIASEEKMIRIFVLPSIAKQIEGLEALGPPKKDEKEIEKIINSMKAGLKKGEKKPYSVSYEVPSEYPFNELSELASAYGFSECTNPT
jgi:hypothetical protein